MLAKKYRVPRQYIDYILKKGDSYTSKLFIVRFKKNHEEFSRYRTIISRKVNLKAVTRNKLRRQVHEAIRLGMPKDSKSGLDIILIAKKNAIKADYHQIEEDIKNNVLSKNGKI